MIYGLTGETLCDMEVLKLRHSLIGRSMIPVIMQVKSQDEPLAVERLTRLKKDHALDQYSLDDLTQQIYGLIGETLCDILMVG